MLVLSGTLRAADLLLPVTGNLLGSVVDSAGIPQMGATIQLLNKYRQPVSQATTDAQGRFAFASLPADLYSLSASLASFLPVSREKVSVKAGLDSVLQIHLATLFSRVEVSYALPAAAMTDDWKWVLRSAVVTRPITRLLPLPSPDAADSAPDPVRAFSETHSFLSVMGGDAGPLAAEASLGFVGTGFGVSTRLYGKNELQVSGTLGEDNLVGPSAVSVSAIYSRRDGNGLGRPPEITFTAAQIAGIAAPFLAAASGGGPSTGSGSPASMPLRTMSLSLYEVADPLDRLHVEYGATGESVDYRQHVNRLSPFARFTVDTGRVGQWLGSYSNGGRPDQLLRHTHELESESVVVSGDDLAASSASLQRLPQISARQGRLRLERTQSFELGYNKAHGSHSYAVSAFYEDVSDGRLSLAGDVSPLLSGNLLSDTLSRASTYNIGHYRRTGYLASLDQRLYSCLQMSLAYGRMGGFATDSFGLLDSNSPSTDRNMSARDTNLAAVSIKAIVPATGTRFNAGYGWTDSGMVVPRHVFTTQQAYAAPGLNIYVRQPLPALFGLPGRLELTADLRNLLAQGYLPLATAGGRQLLIVQAPQSVRGGLNFIF